MKPSWILFALLTALCCLVGYVLTIEEAGSGHGAPHGQIPRILVGGDGTERHAAIIWWGWALGTLEICFFVALLALGIRRREGLGNLKWPLIIGGILYVLVFTLMVVSYWDHADSKTTPLFLSVPVPTAWMLYGLFGIPLFFHALYFACFDRWILTREDLDRFHRLVAARRGAERD